MNYLRECSFILKQRKWRIGLAVLLIILLIGGLGAYHERHNIRRLMLVHQRYQRTDILSTNQIKVNLRAGVSTKHTANTNQLTKQYRADLQRLTPGTDQAKVVVNPYHTSPLSGLILVKTKPAARVTVTVPGDTAATTITHQIKGYRRTHSVGVLGLYAGRTNHVRLTFTQKDGHRTTSTYKLTTAPAPRAIGHNRLKTSHPQQMALGQGHSRLTFAVSSQGLTYGLDAQGQIRWYSTAKISHVFKRLSNHHLLVLTKISPKSPKYNALRETDYYGRVYRQVNFSGLFPTRQDPHKLATNTVIHHDAIELPNHHLLLTVDDGSKKFVEDTMIELNFRTGKIVKVIDLKRILPKSAYQNYHGTTRPDGKIDWFHQNSMYYDTKRDELIISGRNQDMIFAINYRTTKLKWILAAPERLPQSYRHFLLKPTTKHYHYNGGQHAVKLIQTTSHNGHQVALEFYDNNVPVTRGKTRQSKQWSAGTTVTIDQLNRTVTKTWRFGQSLGKRNFTNIVGSSYAVGKGNTLIGFGYADAGKRSEFIEVNRKSNRVVFDVDHTKFAHGDWSYRAQRMTLYPQNNFQLTTIK
ncbi:arylsulfate sulfotransferase [Levilactobacillus senmaizukei DSM 21775 = NBRC 103853]|uniref:Arylsulfate sulfotransferase n=1 Tax=Levilactobacillus senmaizukei DSM 21775 = NBRC 103853 TaxID=1423803 RepID=A0A0R2DDP9_9LACO|nr:aryl-sulfate sulfotransferase [Levilactobacillus senmaizukei]KRN02065.1 arylsulfate sulfotransferase [Levilactobacillus senmaizukei DSM 21775 = NBRC 103853]